MPVLPTVLRRPLVAGQAASALVLLTAAPGTAATPIARASATALEITVANQPAGTGTYEATNDGRQESTSGINAPAVTVLGGQSVISAGTLAQDAATQVRHRSGFSQACAGLAGSGATVAAVGEGTCLTPGDQLDLSAGTLDLSDVQVVESDVTQGLDQQLQDALQPVIDEVVPAAQDAVKQALTQVGDPTLTLGLGAVQSHCAARPGSARADSTLADAGLFVSIGGQDVQLVSLPVHPAPNTQFATDLDQVVQAIDDALQTQLADGLQGALSPLGAPSDELLQALNDNVVSAVAAQLAPLEDNVLSGTLNAQTSPQAGAIEVTALQASVLPAAQAQGLDPLSLFVGRSACGPSGRVAVSAPASSEPAPSPQPKPAPKPAAVPTAVPAGLDHAPDGGGASLLGLGAVVALAGAVGVRSYRRHTGAHGGA